MMKMKDNSRDGSWKKCLAFKVDYDDESFYDTAKAYEKEIQGTRARPRRRGGVSGPGKTKDETRQQT